MENIIIDLRVQRFKIIINGKMSSTGQEELNSQFTHNYLKKKMIPIDNLDSPTSEPPFLSVIH